MAGRPPRVPTTWAARAAAMRTAAVLIATCQLRALMGKAAAACRQALAAAPTDRLPPGDTTLRGAPPTPSSWHSRSWEVSHVRIPSSVPAFGSAVCSSALLQKYDLDSFVCEKPGCHHLEHISNWGWLTYKLIGSRGTLLRVPWWLLYQIKFELLWSCCICS